MPDNADCDCAHAVIASVDDAAAADSVLIRQIDPAARLVACCVFAFVVVSLNRIPTLLTALAMAAAIAFAVRLEPVPTLRRMAALDGFMLMVLGFLPFTVPGDELFAIGDWTASREGIVRGAEILLKSNAVVLMILALLGSMEPSRLGLAMTRLRVSDKFVQLFLFTLRYLDVLGREYRRLRLAMKARCFRMGCNLHTWRSIGYLFGMLLVMSLERSERIVAAMRCRGFNGHFRSLHEARPFNRLDWLFSGTFALACFGLAILERT